MSYLLIYRVLVNFGYFQITCRMYYYPYYLKQSFLLREIITDQCFNVFILQPLLNIILRNYFLIINDLFCITRIKVHSIINFKLLFCIHTVISISGVRIALDGPDTVRSWVWFPPEVVVFYQVLFSFSMGHSMCCCKVMPMLSQMFCFYGASCPSGLMHNKITFILCYKNVT